MSVGTLPVDGGAAASGSTTASLLTAIVPHSAPVIEHAESTRRRSASVTRSELVSRRAAWTTSTARSQDGSPPWGPAAPSWWA